MRVSMVLVLFILFSAFTFSSEQITIDKTISLWLFDEQIGLYPSQVLENNSENNFPLVLGLGGRIVEGKFGNALEPLEHPEIDLPEGELHFGLVRLDPPEGRSMSPLTWYNANFAALMTGGENHLRKEVGFMHPTETKLNLGDFDWTVEFWFYPNRSSADEGTVFEIGTGPRGENDKITRLALDQRNNEFILYNRSTDNRIKITTNLPLNQWSHTAFVYSWEGRELKHYVNGKLISTVSNIEIRVVEIGKEDYMSIARNGMWENPLQGKIDELRFSEDVMYTDEFEPPDSFSRYYHTGYSPDELIAGPPLLFDEASKERTPIQLGNRKHVFIDDAFLQSIDEDIEFNVNPPRKAELVIGDIEGPYRKHLTVVEDEEGLIRIYNSAHDDYLIVYRSTDGVNFEEPNTGIEHRGRKNIVIPEPVGGKGNPFIDPNGYGDHKWKYITSYHNRGVYLYTSPDGWKWTRQKTALIPFRSGTQSCTFYDDQRRVYISTHRTGIFHTPGGATQRSTVVTETDNIFAPILFDPLSQEDSRKLGEKYRIREPQPWWLDNGPLTPGDFGLEFPHTFDPDEKDPVGTDIYITKAHKYEYAPDTYLAFPIVYFHYEMDGSINRQILIDSARERGAGPIETQIAVSRDGLNWKRYYQPAYVAPGTHAGIDIKTAYIAHGMVKRGNEIWQYYFGEPHYHSPWKKYDDKRAVFRLVQRLDGFVSIDSPYEKEAYVTTKPFVFEGNRLILNIDTRAAGYTQVGFLDENGDPIEGFSVEDCVYINGDFIGEEVEWIQNRNEFTDVAIGEGESPKLLRKVITTKDVSSLQGKVVQLVFRMRNTKLYSMQFVSK
jgi:hypothetical protein